MITGAARLSPFSRLTSMSTTPSRHFRPLEVQVKNLFNALSSEACSSLEARFARPCAYQLSLCTREQVHTPRSLP